jgi:hypothetical protein
MTVNIRRNLVNESANISHRALMNEPNSMKFESTYPVKSTLAATAAATRARLISTTFMASSGPILNCQTSKWIL